VEAHRWRAELEKVLERAPEIEHAFPVGSFRWFVVARALIFALGNLGRAEEALARIDALLQLDFDACDPDGIAATLAASAGLSFMIANATRAATLLDALERIESRCNTLLSRAWVERARVVRAWLEGDFARLAVARERAADLFAGAGDVRYAALERCNAGDARKELGDYALAEAHCRAGLADVERMGFRMGVSMCKNNLAFVLARRGHLEEASRIIAGAIQEPSQLPRDLGYAQMYASSIRLAAGDVASALEHAKGAIARFEAIGATALPVAFAHLARAELASNMNEQALVHAMRALAVANSATAAEEGELFVRLVAVEACERNGDRDEALRVVRDASARLLVAAAKISDERLRASYLAISENARILELATALETKP
jgi:hypothetical protein